VSSKLRASLAVLIFGAIILLFISGRVWITANFSEPNSPTLNLPITGRELDPLGAGCSWALIASVLAFLVSSGILRRVVASVMVLLSAAILMSTWNSHGAAIANQVDALTSQAVGRSVVGVVFESNYFWVLAVTCSVLALIAAIFLLLTPSGPKKPARYERSENVADLSPWQALDAGLDPTQD